MTPEVAVVVVTYNSAHVIDGLLDSLPAALGGVLADLVVVDNDSTDDTVGRLQARGDCRVVRSANLGYSAGINKGAVASPVAPAILVLNPDVRLDPGSVPIMMAALGQQGTAVVAPRVLNEDGSLHRSLRRDPTLGRALGLARSGRPALSEYVDDPAEYERPHVVDWALGAVLLVSRSAFDQLGGWDESYFLYSEETDFSLRARDRGWVTRYEPAATSTHIGGASGQSSLTHSMQIVNRVRLYRRRHGVLASSAYYALTMASELSWVARGHRHSLRSLRALARPSARPAELGCSDRLLPL